MVNSPFVFSLTSSARRSTCSVNARRLPHTETFHSVAIASVPKASVMAAGNNLEALRTAIQASRTKYTVLTDVEDESSTPVIFNLAQNYPNPFNPTTKISFSIPESGIVNLKIYDLLGGEVAELINSEMKTGNHSINFDASNLSSGMYFYKIETGSYSQTRKMMLLK